MRRDANQSPTTRDVYVNTHQNHLCGTERKGKVENKQYMRTSIKMDKLADKINRADRQSNKQSNKEDI